jgi:hypothetical protein
MASNKYDAQAPGESDKLYAHQIKSQWNYKHLKNDDALDWGGIIIDYAIEFIRFKLQ